MKAKILKNRQMRNDGKRMDRIVLRGTHSKIADLVAFCAFALGSYTGRFAVEAFQSDAESLSSYIEIEKPQRPRSRGK